MPNEFVPSSPARAPHSATQAPQSATQKLLARAAQVPYVDVGQIVYPDPDLVIIHDGFVEAAYAELSGMGYGAIRRPERTVFVTDHEVAYGSQRAVARGASIREVARQWKVGRFYDVGRGGHGHLFPIEMGLVQPGMFVFAYDMHCTTFGAVGALALGVGTEISSVLATGMLWTQVPATIRIELTGRLRHGSHARDAGFVIAEGLRRGQWHADYDYRVIEFGGSGVESLNLAERVALCNSVTELGVASVLFDAPLPAGAASALGEFRSDPLASYEARIEFELAAIEPQVALPGGPENAAAVSSANGIRVDHAFLGSCGSGMYEDFLDAAAMLRGRRVASGVRLFVVPGSTATARRLADEGLAQVFMDAGAIMLPAGCGPCAGGLMGPLAAGEVSISTAATNHTGRFGPAGGLAYLGSPLTVCASAIAGQIVDPREWLRNE